MTELVTNLIAAINRAPDTLAIERLMLPAIRNPEIADELFARLDEINEEPVPISAHPNPNLN